MAAVLDELLHESAALTRVLLGAGEPSTGAAPGPHAWLDASLDHSTGGGPGFYPAQD